MIEPRSEAAAAELLGVVDRGSWIVGVKSWKEELEKERVKAKAMKRMFFCVGFGFE